MSGVVHGLGDIALGVPREREPVVELAELWIRDSEAYEACKKCGRRQSHWEHEFDGLKHPFEPGGGFDWEWRVVTNFLPTEEILFEPLNPLIAKRHPFHALTLEPMPGYLWGLSPLDALIPLQQWRDKKINELDRRDELQIDPPLFFKGMSTIDGERAKAFRAPGGNITSNNPTAEVQPVVPAPLADPFQFVEHIDADFNRQGGLPRGTSQGEQGVRSGDQAATQAVLSAGPTMVRAMLVEDCIEEVSQAMLELQMQTDTYVTLRSGSQILLKQCFPGDFTVRVASHSASPLYQERIAEKALIAKKEHAITGAAFVEMLGLPMSDVLEHEARELDKARAEQAAEVLDIKRAAAEKKRG